jgi:hypothetical protein
MMSQTLGLPITCPKCPSKHYFGVLWAVTVPTEMVRLGKATYHKEAARTTVCHNCHTPLVPGGKGIRDVS